MMTRSAALEPAPHGTRVIAVAPEFINTSILGNDAAIKEALAKQHLHGKLIESARHAHPQYS
jgi:NAD(P)-dependent dehydrogenase (short-subunit alcohol dehydrogenase family)